MNPSHSTLPKLLKNRAVALLLLILAVVLIAVAIGALGDRSSVATNKEVVKSKQAPSTSPKPTAPLKSFSDGTYKVGVDIIPGTYQTSGGEGCHFTKRNTDMKLTDVQDKSGQAYVTISQDDGYFETSDCGTWQLQE